MLRASIGNGVAKERMCMTHGHEQSREDARGRVGCWVEGGKGEELG